MELFGEAFKLKKKGDGEIDLVGAFHFNLIKNRLLQWILKQLAKR